MKAKVILFLHVTVIAIAMIGISEVLAQVSTWQPPPAGTPPNCPTGYAGCDAPINVGGTSQTKTGLLGLANLIVTSSLQFTPGAATGRVLTSDVNGIASWSDVSSIFGVSKIASGFVSSVVTAKNCNGSPCYATITLPAGFASAPAVFLQPKWARVTNDEVPYFWVNQVTATTFQLNWHAPSTNASDGGLANTQEAGVYWFAIPKSTPDQAPTITPVLQFP